MNMQLELSESDLSTMVSSISNLVIKQVATVLQHDELLTKEQLAKQVYHVGHDTIDNIVSQPGFPYTTVGHSQIKYSRKAVEKYIVDHQRYR